MRRGLTMMELLLALSLLPILVLTVSSWIEVTAQQSAEAAEPARWRAAADAVFQLVHDDLVTGDFAPDTRNVEAVNGVLQIRTRARGSIGTTGAVVHRYTFHALSHELRLAQRAPTGRRSTHVLLEGISEWRCEIDDDQRLLTVRIVPPDGTRMTRRFVLP